MSNPTPIVLILGAGARVGQHVARGFVAKGYKVALVARSSKEAENTANQVNVQGDLADPTSVAEVFSRVKSLLGIPSVVVYNADAFTPTPSNPLSLPLESFTRDLNINTTSVFAAAQQAVLGFEQLPKSASKTFIFTGNGLNHIGSVVVPMFDGGVGKAATSKIMETAATAYKDQGFKFYYADERKVDGDYAYMALDGEAHAEQYVALAEGESQGPWLQTFVKGIGYKDFSA